MPTEKQQFIAGLAVLNSSVQGYAYCFDDYYTLKYLRYCDQDKFVSMGRIARALVSMSKLFLRVALTRRRPSALPQFLFTLLNSKDHLRLLLDNTLQYMPDDACGILQFSAKAYEGHYPVIDGSRLWTSRANLGVCLSALKGAAHIWRFALGLNDLGSRRFRVLILLELLVVHVRSSAVYDSYCRLLQKSKVAAVIVEYDHNERCVPLVLAARHSGIRSYTFQHGLINSPGGFDPVIADQIFVWGAHFRDMLRSYGVPYEKIVVTGCQNLKVPSLQYKDDGLIKVIFATSPYLDTEKELLAESILEAINQSGELNIQLSVKRHPSDRMSYSFPCDAPSFLEDLGTVDALPWCDVVVCHCSTIALDAMRLGKLVIILDVVESRPLTDAIKELLLDQCCLGVRSGHELATTFKQFSMSSDELIAIRDKGMSDSRRYYDCIGEPAGQKAAAVIMAS